MLVYVRLARDSAIDPAEVEEAALGVIGREGTVLGASDTSVDLELSAEADLRVVLPTLAAVLLRVGLSPTTTIDLPESGQRFSISDF